MFGDAGDMARRLAAVLPRNWFAGAATNYSAVLQGIGAAWSALFSLIEMVRAQTRLRTSTDIFLDQSSGDFFGKVFPRRNTAGDASFRSRMLKELLRPRATRAAMYAVLSDLTGRTPIIFEPARSSDTGGYSSGGVGYGVGGGWGNLNLPFQIFITAFRPAGGGIAALAGYSMGGILAYGNFKSVITPVADADILTAITETLPIATIAWTRISA